MSFAPALVSCVLDENFASARTAFLEPLLAIHRAHLVMLSETGIIDANRAARLARGLDSIDARAVREVPFDERWEDLFTYVDGLLERACGADAAGSLHTARSRNDIDMTMYRMRQRELVLEVASAAANLRQALLALAGRHVQTVFAAHTHTQPAQPTTVAHYLLAAVDQLARDHVRLEAAFGTTNRSPLGACAITGTGFPIDRHRTSELLGFDAPTDNTYDSIATVDYVLESASATAVLLVGLGRVVQDLLLWSTDELGYLRLADGLVQGSSIMPQKRNPIALEHARAIASKAVGQAAAIPAVVHNTPFGDIVDTEDDLQPLVLSMFRDAVRAVRLVAASVEGASIDAERMRAGAGRAGTTATELADTLVREHGTTFRDGHRIAAAFVAGPVGEDDVEGGSARRLSAIAEHVCGRSIQLSDAELAGVLSPDRFVAVRGTHGGPAPGETRRALAAAEATLARQRDWLVDRSTRLAEAAARLPTACRELAGASREGIAR